MVRIVFIVFLIAHGAIHLAIWATPAPDDADAAFDASRSWLLGARRGGATAGAVVAAGLLMTSGVALWLERETRPPVRASNAALAALLPNATARYDPLRVTAGSVRTRHSICG